MKKFLLLLGVILLAGGVWLAWEYRPINVDEVCQYYIEQDKETTNTDDKEKRKSDSIHQPEHLRYFMPYNLEKVIDANAEDEIKTEYDSINRLEYLAEHFTDTAGFEAWYKKLNQDAKNTVLATTVAACRPELTEIALANGGDINTRITTYYLDVYYPYFHRGGYYIYARLRKEDDSKNDEKAEDDLKYLTNMSNNNISGTFKQVTGYNNGLLSYGIASCSCKQVDEAYTMINTLLLYGADVNRVTTIDDPEISELRDNLLYRHMPYSPYHYYNTIPYSVKNYLIAEKIIATVHPLEVAISMRNQPVIKYLLTYGADVNEGITQVLTYIYDTKDKIKEYRKYRKEIGEAIKGKEKHSYISYCCDEYNKLKELKEKQKAYLEILDLLLPYLQKGRISPESASVVYLYQNYYLRDDKEIVSMLEKLEVKPDYNSEIMKKAMSDYRTNYGEAVKDLVEHGVDVNSVDDMRRTALHVAVHNADAETVKYLLEHGAEVNLQDTFGFTALVETIEMWNTDKKNKATVKIVQMLLEYGADVNLQTRDKSTAFDYALGRMSPKQYKEKVIELLIKHGLKINDQDDSGRTPLFYAVKYHGEEVYIINLLLQYGADVNIKDKDGNTVLSMLKTNSNIKRDIRENIEKMLKDRGAY